MVAEQQPALFEVGALSDAGTERGDNEDACGAEVLASDHVVAVVADGISGMEGGEVASRKAVETTLRVYREQQDAVAPVKRLVRAVQQANIEIHDMALVVPELRGMGTTLTAVALLGGQLAAAHVGDSRLILVRDGRPTQLTKDHTVAAERARLGLLKKDRVRDHDGHSILTRCLGRELIASIDRLTTTVGRGDRLLLCTDGLHNVLSEAELARLAGGPSAIDACRQIVDTANACGTPDNLTTVVLRLTEAAPPLVARPSGVLARFARVFRRHGPRATA